MAELLKMFHEAQSYWHNLAKGDEYQALKVLSLCDYLYEQWRKTHDESTSLKAANKTYQDEASRYRVEVKKLEASLIEARSQLAAMMSSNSALQSDNQKLSSQIDQVRELLKDETGIPEWQKKKLEFLNEQPSAQHAPRSSTFSVLSDNCIDYDKTDDSLEHEDALPSVPTQPPAEDRNRKRSRSVPRVVATAPPIEDIEGAPKKRSKDDSDFEIATHNADGDVIVATTTLTVPCSIGKGVSSATVVNRRSLNRSISVPQLVSPPNVQNGIQPMPQYILQSADDLTPGKLVLSTYPSCGSLSARKHTFLTKTTFKPESCDVCGKRFPFGKSFQRCTGCKMQCHMECRMRAAMPCIMKGTPTSKAAKLRLADFVPQCPPMIPHILVHCVMEIERRGLDAIGLYRIPGSESKVNALVEKFLWHRGIPNLKLETDVNVLAGCIKKFLQILKEPVVPLLSWSEFVLGAQAYLEKEDGTVLSNAVAELPQPNRETLAFLILHLKKVAELSDRNKMPATNLGKIFGPTVVGYSSETIKMPQAAEEAVSQEKVMVALLTLPEQFWLQFLNDDPLTPLYNNHTPNSARFNQGSEIRSMLGPLSKERSGRLGNARSLFPKTPQKFFQEPWK